VNGNREQARYEEADWGHSGSSVPAAARVRRFP
jgi:hypothetical protein